MTDEITEQEIAGRTVPEPLKQWTGALLNRTTQKLLECFESRISGSGLKSKQFSALVLLESAPTTQIELGRMLWIDRTSMTAMIDDLEARDYVRRERHPEDRRAYLVSLTSHGQQTLERARVVADEVEVEVLAPLSGEELSTLRELLSKLV